MSFTGTTATQAIKTTRREFREHAAQLAEQVACGDQEPDGMRLSDLCSYCGMTSPEFDELVQTWREVFRLETLHANYDDLKATFGGRDFDAERGALQADIKRLMGEFADLNREHAAAQSRLREAAAAGPEAARRRESLEAWTNH